MKICCVPHPSLEPISNTGYAFFLFFAEPGFDCHDPDLTREKNTDPASTLKKLPQIELIIQIIIAFYKPDPYKAEILVNNKHIDIFLSYVYILEIEQHQGRENTSSDS